VLQSCAVLFAFKCGYILPKFTFRTFYAILGFSHFITAIHKSLQQNRHFTLQSDFDVRDSNVHDGLVGPG
jgi:hypothetical protein